MELAGRRRSRDQENFSTFRCVGVRVIDLQMCRRHDCTPVRQFEGIGKEADV